jgi:hypothetical protein
MVVLHYILLILFYGILMSGVVLVGLDYATSIRTPAKACYIYSWKA